MLPQRLATGATGVKQVRYRQGPTSGTEELVRACCVSSVLWPLALAVQCKTMHGDACIQCLHMNSAEGFAL